MVADARRGPATMGDVGTPLGGITTRLGDYF